MTTKQTGVAVVGGGRIGLMHARIFAAIPQVNLTGVVVRSGDGERLKNAGLDDAKVYTDIKNALDDKAVDAVAIAASTDAHAELIRACIGAGRPVFCEKPVASTGEAIAALRAESEAAKVPVQIGFNRRFDPNVARLRESLQQNALGKLYLLHIVNMDAARPPKDFVANSGGMFIDFNVHDFDMLAYLTGEAVEEVYARAANLVDSNIGKHGDVDTAVLSAKMRGGALASVLCSRETNCGYDQRIEILGEKGALHLQNLREHALMRADVHGRQQANPPLDFIARYRESYKAQARAFVQVARATAPVSVGLAEAEAAVRASVAAAKSRAENRAVKVG